MTELV